jgi:PAS domain S-box-containing protein
MMNLVGASATSDLDGLLARSPIAMLLADDQRRYVDANEAACTLLGLSRAELLEAGVDRLTPVALRGSVPALWERFLSQGAMQGVYELTDASGRLIRITYVAVAQVLPGLHLSCLLTGRPAGSGGALSSRERDVVGLAAQGLTSNEVARTLSLSRATVETHFRRAVRRIERPQPSPRHRTGPHTRRDRPANRDRGAARRPEQSHSRATRPTRRLV